MFEDRVEDGRRSADSGYAAHGCAIEVSDPYADGVLGGEAHRPVVAEIGARPGLARHWKIEPQCRMRAEGGSPRGVVIEYVGDQPCAPWIADQLRVLRGWLRDAQSPRFEFAETSETRIGVGQLHQTCLGIADGESESIFVRRLGQCGESQIGEPLLKH